jgi:hypothetical protein
VPKILIQEGGQQSVFELFDDEITIGRGAANAIQVADGHASKHHAVVRRLGGRVKLVDLESKNGTRVNGEFKNQRWLAHGDVVAIGAMTMTFDGSDLAAVPVAAAYAAPAVVSGPALAVMAAPAPAAPAAPRTTTRRVRDDDRGDRGDRGDREERPRGVPRRSNNNAVVAMMVGAGVIGLIVILILMVGGGAGKNALALRTAALHARRRQAAAASAPTPTRATWTATSRSPEQAQGVGQHGHPQGDDDASWTGQAVMNKLDQGPGRAAREQA